MKNISSSLSRKQPKIIPYALGNPEDPVKWTHDLGIVSYAGVSYSRFTQSGKYKKPSISELTP